MSELSDVTAVAQALQGGSVPIIVYLAWKMNQVMERFDSKLDTLINYLNPKRSG